MSIVLSECLKCLRITQTNFRNLLLFYTYECMCSIRIIVYLSTVISLAMSLRKYPVTLITFDVDGTLVIGTKVGTEVTAHSRAFIHAAGKLFTDDNKFEEEHDTPLSLIPEDRYHGCTDGLIILNTIKYAFNIPSSESSPRLQELFSVMYQYIAKISDEDVVKGIRPLPGVIDTLRTLANGHKADGNAICGLLTGNVEGIARKKMRACGIFGTGVLNEKGADQFWEGENDHSFLGGFGSDYCSCDIEDQTRLYKDRGEQIAIAYKRARTLIRDDQEIVRVVHVGDAPADVLAAKWCCEESKFDRGVTVGFVGVATGRYSAQVLAGHAGDIITGVWEPVVLEDGLADPTFIQACGIVK